MRVRVGDFVFGRMVYCYLFGQKKCSEKAYKAPYLMPVSVRVSGEVAVVNAYLRLLRRLIKSKAP